MLSLQVFSIRNATNAKLAFTHSNLLNSNVSATGLDQQEMRTQENAKIQRIQVVYRRTIYAYTEFYNRITLRITDSKATKTEESSRTRVAHTTQLPRHLRFV